MKKSVLFLLLSLFVFCVCSCSKRDYWVRFKNEYNETIIDVTAGNAILGTVPPGETSDYKKITGRSFLIKGTSATGRQLNGSETISGKGTHRWTITLTSTGTITFAED